MQISAKRNGTSCTLPSFLNACRISAMDCSVLCVLLVVSCLAVQMQAEWVQVPLLHAQDSPGAFHGDIPPRIAEKLDALAVSLRRESVTDNNTKQMDIDLSQLRRVQTTTTTTTVKTPVKVTADRKVDVQATKKRIAEPFSIWTFLRSIRDSLFYKPTRSVQQKVGFLEGIRNNILQEIKRRILGVFLIGDQKRGHRSKRHLEYEDHGHEFASTEGALVTICFLTFSVFLIKLVLQIIYILKRKHYNMTTTGTDMMGTVGAVRNVVRKNQNARTMDPDNDEEDKEQFLTVIRGIAEPLN